LYGCSHGRNHGPLIACRSRRQLVKHDHEHHMREGLLAIEKKKKKIASCSVMVNAAAAACVREQDGVRVL